MRNKQLRSQPSKDSENGFGFLQERCPTRPITLCDPFVDAVPRLHDKDLKSELSISFVTENAAAKEVLPEVTEEVQAAKNHDGSVIHCCDKSVAVPPQKHQGLATKGIVGNIFIHFRMQTAPLPLI